MILTIAMALAIQQTTTCSTISSITTCHTSAPPAPPVQGNPNAFPDGIRNGQQIIEQLDRARRLPLQGPKPAVSPTTS
ncbi:hypothetical protein [Brevundimonas sp. GCM10030266]|uniref:hypothetical protein n=1 Tax=Brevundimonas sp. GCM10030266 TaxID=3273386 RepID=UPI00360AD1D1